jgi:hypothetical protein
MTLRKFVIEREVPKIGTLDGSEMRGVAGKSNAALQRLPNEVQWQQSYVAENKTYCIYLAVDEDAIRKHAELSGFPANRITEIRRVIDPTTERNG